MKKRNIAKVIGGVAMAAAMLFTMAACGGGNTNTGKKTHDQTTHVVTGSDPAKTVHHNFVDGKCTMCDQTTIFRQDPMLKSPEILLTEQEQKGTVESFWYKTRAYGVEEKFKDDDRMKALPEDQRELWIYKKAWIYLPNGYTPTKKYNVLYMMHGNKLNEGYWFARGSYERDKSAFTGGYGTENMLDYMHANGLAEDTIYVGMTMYQYYSGRAREDRDDVSQFVGGSGNQGNIYSGYVAPENDNGADFGIGEAGEGVDSVYWKEWFYHLMPYVVENYSTYATSNDEAGYKAARDHVGFTGLSRGGSSVTSVLTNCLEYISYYAYESSGSPSQAAIENMKAKKAEYPVNYMLISCGSQEGPEGGDANMVKCRDAMGYKEGSDIKNGDQIEFIQVNGTAHNYATWITNLYNLMLVAFKK